MAFSCSLNSALILVLVSSRWLSQMLGPKARRKERHYWMYSFRLQSITVVSSKQELKASGPQSRTEREQVLHIQASIVPHLPACSTSYIVLNQWMALLTVGWTFRYQFIAQQSSTGQAGLDNIAIRLFPNGCAKMTVNTNQHNS